MNRRIAALLHRMPELMVWFAALFYGGTVIASLAAGDALYGATGFGLDTLPVLMRLKLVVIVFVQPLVSVMALLFGAALLWRLDRLLAHRSPEIHS